MRFDARAAKALEAGKAIVYEDAKGLRLEATESKRTWTYRFKSPVDGRMRQVKIGEWPAIGWPAAVARWQELKALRESGVDPALDKKKLRRQAEEERLVKVTTVSDIVEAYARDHLAHNREEKGARAVSQRIRTATEEFASMPAAEVTRKMVFDLMAGLSDKAVLAKSVKAELGAAWNLALDGGMLPSETPNWWRQVAGPKLKSKGAMRDGERKGTAKRVLADSEVSLLLKSDIHLMSEVVRDVVTLYLWTCSRGVELVQMHARQVTEEDDGWWWTLPKALTKNRHIESANDHRVPLVGRALQVVSRRKERFPAGYLFPSEGKVPHILQPHVGSPIHFRMPYSKSRPDITRERFKVTHWSPHDLRRTGRTMLAAMGCPNEIAEAIIGHVQPGIVGTYNLYHYDKEKRHWLGLLSSRLEALAG